MYKVFIREVPLIICNSKQISESEKEVNIKQFYDDFDWETQIDSLHYKVYVVGDNVAEIWNSFKSYFKGIAAAGGMVKNDKEEILCIFRNGKWDLPKGKVEEGEELEDAAIREVEEECGIGGLTITSKLKSTYHTYNLGGKNILKTTYWYSMKTDWSKVLAPQLEEGITKVEWISKADLGKVRSNTYKSILELIA
ncbi:MAG: NUDIX domain-containing protein [Flavobacteriales bacterium]|nr:NUDIX domain-containing protein [Flavobacteriales bacterium]